MRTIKTIFKMTDKEIDDILKSNHKFALLVKRVSSFIESKVFYKIKDLTVMTIEELIRKLPKELVHYELKEFIIYKPKTNKELEEAVKLFTNNPKESFKLYGHIENWDTSLITNMAFLFYCNDTFNSDISNWNVSNVINMNGMFDNASIFNQSLNSWDVGKVKDMNSMFLYAIDFNQPLDKWNVSNVTDMGFMFCEATSFNQPLNEWDVSNVTNMNRMFQHTYSFNQSLNEWDVSKVTNMDNMFKYTKFNKALDLWINSKIKLPFLESANI